MSNDSTGVYKKYAGARLEGREVDEFIGLCRGVLADGDLNHAEAEYLQRWLENNRLAMNEWPASVLYPRLKMALADGRIDSGEELDLLTLLMEITGEPIQEESGSKSTALPFDDPMPDVVHADKNFVLTGQFVCGTRAAVAAEIKHLGGVLKGNCNKSTHYLLVGTLGSAAWLHSTHGTKILRAIELRDAGSGIAIISEEHWYIGIGADGN